LRFSRFSRVAAIVAVITLVLVPTMVATARGRASATIHVDGRRVVVHSGDTVSHVLEQLHLRPVAGNLLDVQGNVLEHGTIPGSVLVNGRPARESVSLATGDTIALVRGADRTEPTVRQVYENAGGPTDPQFSLAGGPGREIVVFGRISGEVVSATFEPTGPLHEPRAVALTFDDGPGPYTSRFLNVLRRNHVPATFFVIGIHVQAHPDLVRAEWRSGMSVGNHSWDHPTQPPFAKLSRARMKQEIDQTDQLLVSMGIVPALFRPPGGGFSPRLIDAARDVDARVVLWDVDPKDWMRGRTPSQITRSVLRAVKPGSIVELHDGGPNPAATLAALPGIIRGIRAMGLQFVALGAS